MARHFCNIHKVTFVDLCEQCLRNPAGNKGVTMEITKKGGLPKERIIKGRCAHCGTEFRAKAGEGKRYDCQRDGVFYEFTCPLPGCNATAWGYPETGASADVWAGR